MGFDAVKFESGMLVNVVLSAMGLSGFRKWAEGIATKKGACHSR